MGDNKSAVVGKRFEMECYTFGYESKREHGLVRLTKSKRLETTASVTAEPGYSLGGRLEQKAKAMAQSIKPHGKWGNCNFKRFLPEAEQVLSLESQFALQDPKTVFTPNQDSLIPFEARSEKTVRCGPNGGEFCDIPSGQTFTIPFIQDESPVATAQRVLKEVENNEWSTPRSAIMDASDRLSVFAFNPGESYFIGQAIKLNRQVVVNIEAEEKSREAEQRRLSKENYCPPYHNACY